MNTKTKIYDLIKKKLDIIKIDIIDNSYKHINHKKDTKGGHYKVLIVSENFKNCTLIDRHKTIYEIIYEELMKHNSPFPFENYLQHNLLLGNMNQKNAFRESITK